MAADVTVHVPVLAQEVLAALDVHTGDVVADGTLGGGGHTRLLAERVGPSGCVVAVDRDPAVLIRAERALDGLPVKISQSNFCELPEVLDEAGYGTVQGMLLDLGLSSDQLADRERGFSFDSDGPLDMRFDPERGEPAWKLLARMKVESLADLIYEYGEERFSRRVARATLRDGLHRGGRPRSARSSSVRRRARRNLPRGNR